MLEGLLKEGQCRHGRKWLYIGARKLVGFKGGVSCKMSMSYQQMGSGEKEEKSRNHSQALLKPSDLTTRPTSAFAYKYEWRGIYTPIIFG